MKFESETPFFIWYNYLSRMRGNFHVRFWGGRSYSGPYPNFSFARPITKKPTFLRLRGSFEYEIQSWKYSIPLFFTTQGFDIFRNREISTGAGAIREQLADLDSVSYTHLRAHETLANLVCRLLLEKKKGDWSMVDSEIQIDRRTSWKEDLVLSNYAFPYLSKRK